MSPGNVINRSTQAVLLTVAALTLALSLVSIGLALAESPSQGQDEFQIYLPLISRAPSPEGSYWCNEYEYGLIWTTEVITLNADGTSIYEYHPPYPGIVTGTWVYTPATQEVGFTNFRWPTATYQAPGRLWAWRYLPEVGFDIALDCARQESSQWSVAMTPLTDDPLSLTHLSTGEP